MRGIPFFSVFRKCAAGLALLLAVSWTSSASAREAVPEIAPVKNVILFVGDGMALTQRSLAKDFLRITKKRELVINDMPYAAMTNTHSANSVVTDSAASATAFACGEKTKNGWLGLAPQGADGKEGRRLVSCAEAARDAGRRVGIVTSDALNGATPAGFYAHNLSRGNYYEIGQDLIASGFDYFGGGRIAQNNNEKSPNYKGDIYDLAREAGYTVLRTPEEVRALDAAPAEGKVIAACGISYAIDAAPGDLHLADFTRQAIARLDNPKGFFLMVEESNPDSGGHSNDAAAVLQAVLSLDKAVAVALEFASRNPDTLIAVTGDHETGGLTLVGGSFDLLPRQKASRGAIAGAIKQLGKERGEDAATMPFSDLHKMLSEKTGLAFVVPGKDPIKSRMQLAAKDEEALAKIFAKKKETAEEFSKVADELARALVNQVNSRAGAKFSTGGHSALPVVTTAIGPGAQAFSGIIDNTEIAKRLKEAVR